ncbi:hypothetical protein PVL29_010703 [Vitis rotundifolia]|uniref:Uncharacterized protein n=1 Tax=Vitis rotundifolia TaxID=103349 RepID=A0AA38ZV35_VITRO|nr:hypothetical protein PVL29_010703 [Vitis rotundifolia]
MGRAPCCDKANVKKGPWSPEEDSKLKEYIEKYGTGGNWIALPQKAGLRRCGKSCRLRWLNYLRPNIKHGEFSDDEDRIICSVFASIGSKWSVIANYLPGRTDNDIKNYWNTKLKKKLMGMVPVSQRKPHQATFSHHLQTYSSLSSHSHAVTTTATSSSYESNSSNPYYTPAAPTPTSFTRLEPISSIPSSLLNINTGSTAAAAIHPQEGFASPIHQYQVKDNLLIEASSSSDDGSGSNQISHGKEPEYDQYGAAGGRYEQLGFQNYVYTGLDDQNQRFMISNGSGGGGGSGSHGWTDQRPNGMLGETPLDLGLEEIKQLISTNLCNNFSFDENKTEERVMYY